MSSDIPFQPRPAEYKTSLDGQGGLVRIPVVGAPHDGRELFIDEMEIPGEIYAAARTDRFEWWPARLREAMSGTDIGGDPAMPPIRYVLRIDEDTREPLFVAETGAR
jgi:hypothetical protein